jgi:hypothetical protein
MLLAATIGLVTWFSVSDPDGEQTRLSSEQWRQLLSEYDRFSSNFSGSRLHLASLHERDRQSAVRGHVVWDRLSRQVHFYAFDLPPSTEGRPYQIWLVRRGFDPVAVGTFAPHPDGTATILVDVPDGIEEPFHVAVTEQEAEAPLEAVQEPWLTTEVE